jgi:hypothetical protein
MSTVSRLQGENMSDQGATAQAKDKAQEVGGQAQEKAQEAAGQARDRMRSEMDQRSTQAGEQVASQAQDLRSVSDQLRQQGKDQPAKIAEQVADRLEQTGRWLKESDPDQILGDVEDMARKNPWAVMAGGFALGFAASRVLKASSRDRYRDRSMGDGAGADRRALPAGSRSTAEGRFGRPPSQPTPGASRTVPPPATPGAM